jgi:predicted AlkP superfamily phosphohydrolase/phosphomutase
MTTRPVHKVVVIGLDGVDWRLLRPWIAGGYLPVLGKLAGEGANGRLQSTIRPESSIAWSTFATGVNPGKHGIFGFARHQPGSYNFHLADGRHIAARRFWDYLGAAGCRVGLVNVPFTYPPRPMNGFLVGGMLTPGPHVSFTYPPELQERLLARLPSPFLFDAGDNTQDKAQLWQHVAAYTDQQLRSALFLLREEVWDCFSIVFTGPDRLQHFFGVNALAAEERSAEHVLLPYFQQLDQAVGQIVAELPDDTLVLIISDHGFNDVGRRFFINKWLRENGYLVLREGRSSAELLTTWLTRLKSVPLVRRLKRALLPANWGVARWKTAVFAHPIEWSQTRAYYAPDGGLRLNLQGREPQGLVPPDEYETLRAELMTRLSALVDPETGFAPIAQIYRRETLYDGPLATAAPDLIVEPHRDQPESRQNYLIDGKLTGHPALFGPSAPYIGNHAPEGILLAWGAAVAKGAMPDVSQLQDIAPTILAALGVPVPNTMDGRVLQELFVAHRRPEPRFVDEPDTAELSAEPSLTEPETAVAERLRNLGYLD